MTEPDKQRRGAVVGLGRRRDQKRVDAGGRQRDGADKAGRPAADDRDFGGKLLVHVHNCRRSTESGLPPSGIEYLTLTA